MRRKKKKDFVRKKEHIEFVNSIIWPKGSKVHAN